MINETNYISYFIIGIRAMKILITGASGFLGQSLTYTIEAVAKLWRSGVLRKAQKNLEKTRLAL